MKKLSNLKFKGKRKYLQAPDIINALIDEIGEVPKEIKILRSITKNIEISASENENTCAVFKTSTGIHFLNTCEQYIDSSTPYNEEDVLFGVKIIENRAVSIKSSFTVLEIATAIFKKILMNKHGVSKKYIFCRLRSFYDFPLYSAFEFNFNKKVGKKYYQSTLTIDNTIVAEILFVDSEMK